MSYELFNIMKEDTPDDPIRDYLTGKLPPSDREAFDKRLGVDPELARELAARRAEMAVSELLIESDTRALFREWQSGRSGATGRKLLYWTSSIAAVFILGFVAFQWLRPAPPLLTQEQKPAPPEKPASPVVRENRQPAVQAPAPPAKSAENYALLAARLLPEPVLFTLRRAQADSILSAFARAEQAYAAGDYPGTLQWLAQTDSTRQQAAAFLSAHALFKQQRYAEAEVQFSRLVETNSRQFRYSAEWGRLMCRVAVFPRGEKETRALLKDITSRPDHPLSEQARTLEKKLRE